MWRIFVMLPVSAVLAVLVAGCGGGQSSAPVTSAPRDGGIAVTAAPTSVTPTTPTTATTSAMATTGPADGPAASCTDTEVWGTGSKKSARSSTAPIFLSRIGRHECYDRVVFDLNGPGPVGYQAGYVPVVTEDGSGRELSVPGGAALQLIIHAPTQGPAGDNSGHQPGKVFAPSGDYLHGPRGLENWGALRAVRSAGSFEGQSTFAIGVRDRLPFTVTTWTDRDQITHVIVDIAHHQH